MSIKKTISYPFQRGQAAVFVMLFLAILLVASLALFKVGKITSNKMQLQNAADAAAYSMSVVEARDLNFAAYMNRAMVANEVAIGQLVGLASWAYHFKSFADYIDSYNQLFLSPLTLGASNTIVTPITSAWRTAGSTAVTVMKTIANYGTLVIHNINKIYGASSFGYHTVSILFAVGVIDDVIEQNGPPGTKVSDFGIISLIAHIYTYGVLPTSVYDLPGDQFIDTNIAAPFPNSMRTSTDVDEFGGEDDGYARLSALIRDSRDPFTMARGWELRPPYFPIDVDVSESIKISIGVASVEFGFDFSLYFDLSLERKGASELRIVLPSSGDIGADYFNWSSADTTGLFVDLAISLSLWAEACVGVSPLEVCGSTSIGGGFEFGDSTATLYVEILGEEITILDGIPFPTSAPFASGFAEVGKSSPNNLGTDDMLLASLGGVIETDHYGEAANNMLAWISPGPSVPAPIGIAASAEIYETLLGSRVNKSYSGLPTYVDTTGNDSFLGIGAPNLLIGLVQDESDFDSTTDYDEPAGRFELNEAMADDELGILAKSEVYFSRPTDNLASHFHRGDGQAEYGSAFNPYWQARLIDTEYSDRILALLIQQKEDFINLGQSFNTVFGDLMDLLPF